MQVMEIDVSRREYWDKEVVQFQNAHPFNCYGWGQVRAIDGWVPSYFVVKRENKVRGMIMVIRKKIPYTKYSIMYAPKGPIYDPNDTEVLNFIVLYIKGYAKKNNTIFVRIDPSFSEGAFNSSKDPFIEQGFFHLKHRWSFWNSPRDVARIYFEDIKDEDELFKTLDPKVRWSIRKAKKEGVTIKSASTIEELKSFYEIFSAFTIERGFACRSFNYQMALWTEFLVKGHGNLFLAVYRGEIIAGALCIMFNGKCLGMHMAVPSSNKHLQIGPALIWENIKWVYESGGSWFSFRGVGSTPEQARFKERFSPEVTSFVGYYDLPLKPILYKIFCLAEFDVLPRVWKSLMKVRKIYSGFLTFKNKV